MVHNFPDTKVLSHIPSRNFQADAPIPDGTMHAILLLIC